MEAKAAKRVAVRPPVLQFLIVLQSKIDAVCNVDSLTRMRHDAYNVWARTLEHDQELWEAWLSMWLQLGIPEGDLLEDQQDREATTTYNGAQTEWERQTQGEAEEGQMEEGAGDVTFPHHHFLRYMQGLLVIRHLHGMVKELLSRHKVGKGGIKRGAAIRTEVAQSSKAALSSRKRSHEEAVDPEPGALEEPPPQRPARKKRSRDAPDGPRALEAKTAAAAAVQAGLALQPLAVVEERERQAAEERFGAS